MPGTHVPGPVYSTGGGKGSFSFDAAATALSLAEKAKLRKLTKGRSRQGSKRHRELALVIPVASSSSTFSSVIFDEMVCRPPSAERRNLIASLISWLLPVILLQSLLSQSMYRCGSISTRCQESKLHSTTISEARFVASSTDARVQIRQLRNLCSASQAAVRRLSQT